MLEGFSPRAQERLLKEVGVHITNILDTTREMVRDEVERGLQQGLGPGALGDAIEDAAAFSEYRGELIARTETATLLNRAATETYRDYGVTHVEVIDGTDDDECAEANGQTWTLEEAEANPIAHPNCVRDFVPIIGEPAAAAEEGGAPATRQAAPPLAEQFDNTYHLERMPKKYQTEIGNQFGELQARIPLRMDTIGVGNTTDFPEMRGAGALTVNGDRVYFSQAVVRGDAERQALTWRFNKQSGFNVDVGSDMTYLEYVTTHEYAHMVDSALFDYGAATEAMPVASTYASTDLAERWAEGFAQWFAGVDSPAARWVADKLTTKGIK